MQKIKFHQFILEIQSNWESCDQTGVTQTVFDQLFIYMNLYQHVENHRLFYWSVLEIWLIKKSCNLIGWEHFVQYLRNKNFPKHAICAGTQRTNSVKIKDQIFREVQKTCFWTISSPISQFWGQKIFFHRILLSSTTSYRFLAPC